MLMASISHSDVRRQPGCPAARREHLVKQIIVERQSAIEALQSYDRVEWFVMDMR
jgi:hypothetical protein